MQIKCPVCGKLVPLGVYQRRHISIRDLILVDINAIKCNRCDTTFHAYVNSSDKILLDRIKAKCFYLIPLGDQYPIGKDSDSDFNTDGVDYLW